MANRAVEYVATIEGTIANETARIKAQASIVAISVPALLITVPMNAMIIQPAETTLLEGLPLPTAAQVQVQIAAMNAASGNTASIPGSTPTGVAAITPFLYQPCHPVQTAPANDAWYAFATGNTPGTTRDAMKTVLRIGGKQTLNMYVKPSWRCAAGYC